MPGLSVQAIAEPGSEPGWPVLEPSASYPPERRKLLCREEQGTQLGQDRGISQLSAQLPRVCLPVWPHLTGGTTNPSLETTLGSSPPQRPLLPSPGTTRLCYANPSPPAPPPAPGSAVFSLRSRERLTALAPSRGALEGEQTSPRVEPGTGHPLTQRPASGWTSTCPLCAFVPSVPPLAASPARLVVSGLCG